MPNLPLISFNAGVLSPLIDVRSDIEKYSSGCRTLENFIPRIYGPVERRPGTKYIYGVKSNSVASTVRPFIYSTTIAYIVEFGNLNLRFFYNGGILLDPTNPVEVTTSYLEVDLPQLQYKQSADVMWIVHGSYAPRKLSRTSATAFSLDTITFNKGPFLERNDIAKDDKVTMTIAGLTIATATAGAAGVGTFTITSATDISSIFSANQRFYVDGSTGNDGAYTVHASTATDYTGTTVTIYTNETIADGTDDGDIMVKGGTGTLTSSTNTFTVGSSGHEDALFKLTQKRVQTVTKGSKSSTGVIGEAIDVKGSFTFNTSGNWDATVELQRNEDGTNWETFRSYTSVITSKVGSRNIQKTDTEDADNVQYRINVTSYTSGTINSDITVNESTQDGIVRISSVNSSTVAQITFVTPVPLLTATKRWAEGAWSMVRGYPKTFTFFEERAVYAKDQTIWFSKTGKFENFEEGANDADSFSLVLLEADAIQWIDSLEALVVGTAGGEWRIRSTTFDEALTPVNYSVKQQTSFGNKDIQTVKVNEAVLFVDYVGHKIREMTYRDDKQKFVAPDLTALAEHITSGVIVDYAYQRNPDSILWIVLNNGTLLSMTYEREQNVIAWSKHPIGGSGVVESVAVIPSSAEDEIWLTVKRTINSSVVRYIEQIQPRDWGSDDEDVFFVDSGLTYSGTATTTLSGLSHLEGETVKVLGNGAIFPDKVVSGGSITLDESVTKAHVGLSNTYKLEPMRLDISTQSGTTSGSIKKISEIVINFFKTLNAQYGDNADTYSIDWRTTEVYDSPPNLFTGMKTVPFDSGFSTEDTIIISGSDPLPCVVRSIIPRVEKTGR